MIFLEVNEFSPSLLAQAADELGLVNAKKLLSLKHSQTFALEKEERFGLDPWVQWVSIHTGLPAAQHNVGHLGDVPQLSFPQIWERLSERGISSGVWGAMNASKANAEKCQFFFPDPWTFSEQAYPAPLNDLLEFPRYFSKNYGDLSAWVSIKLVVKLLRFALKPRHFKSLAPLLPTLMTSVARHGLPEYLLFVLFDLVNTKLFVDYHRRFQPQFSVLFLNSIAHLQHHKWTDQKQLSAEMKVAFAIFDRILGYIEVLRTEKNLPLICANAFSQRCSFDENEYLYRQSNPEQFLQSIGIRFSHLEQAMTNDGHVFFDTRDELEFAASRLEAMRIGEMAAFSVDRSRSDENRLFFQFIIWRKIQLDERMQGDSIDIKFREHFDEVTRRSGVHLQEGDVFFDGIELPTKLLNLEISNYISSFFGASIASSAN